MNGGDDLYRQLRSRAYFGLREKPARRLMTEEEALASEEVSISDLVSSARSSNSLDLAVLALTEFPREVLELRSLTELDVSKNCIKALPEEVGSLGFLKKLVARQNRLTVVPDSLAVCDELTHLDLGNNLLSDLPESYEDLFLEVLRLDYNYFREVPLCCLKIGSLKEVLLLENSSLVTLPPPSAWANASPTMQLSLDNSPELAAAWDSLRSEPKFPPIQVTWNKIWPDHVLGKLFLGSLRTVQNMAVFEQLGVTHVLTCGRNLSTNIPQDKVKQLILEVEDTEDDPLHVHFGKAIKFIKEALATGGTVIVHCFAGVSRSSSVVIAYLIQEEKMSFAAALRFLKEHRPAVNPNPNFVNQLLLFESNLQKGT